MSNALAIADPADVLERVITQGDLSKLTPTERVSYYRAVCASVNLNPLTKPFDYINLNGKLTLYATKTATDQLRSVKGISIDRCERDASDPEFATWLVTGHDAAGRVDTEIGSVSVKGLAGEARANAIMKALTKGKRRLTLSLAGLGWLDETEVGSIPAARLAVVDAETGEIAAPPLSLPEAIAAKAAAVAAVPSVTEDGEIMDAAMPVPVDAPLARCEALSPYEGSEQCRRESGHEGNHKSSSKESWPA